MINLSLSRGYRKREVFRHLQKTKQRLRFVGNLRFLYNDKFMMIK